MASSHSLVDAHPIEGSALSGEGAIVPERPTIIGLKLSPSRGYESAQALSAFLLKYLDLAFHRLLKHLRVLSATNNGAIVHRYHDLRIN